MIFAGDGDYAPLIEAVMRLGQYVVLGFFADSGLSPELQIAADEFVDLGPILVNDWTRYQSEEAEVSERRAAERRRAVEPGTT